MHLIIWISKYEHLYKNKTSGLLFWSIQVCVRTTLREKKTLSVFLEGWIFQILRPGKDQTLDFLLRSSQLQSWNRLIIVV